MISTALMGSRPLARRCLTRLNDHDDIDVRAVVTYPQGHDGWWEGSLYETAIELGIDVVDEEELFEFDLEYIVSVLYYNILEADLLDHPSEGCINLHQAELPRYRGSNTFSHAIMNARQDDYWRYGTTLHFMDEEVDTGDIIGRNFVEITEEDTAKSLYRKTESASVKLFERYLDPIANRELAEYRTPQSAFDGPQYFYSKESLEGEKEIPYQTLTDEASSLAVYDKVRALDFPPFEPAYTYLSGRQVYLTTNEYAEIVE